MSIPLGEKRLGNTSILGTLLTSGDATFENNITVDGIVVTPELSATVIYSPTFDNQLSTVPGYIPTAITVFEQYTHSSTFTRPYTTASLDILCVRMGNFVAIKIPAFTGSSASATNFTMTTVLPARFRPAAQEIECCNVYNGSAQSTPGAIFVATSGAVGIYLTGASAAFAGSGTVAVAAKTVCYFTA